MSKAVSWQGQRAVTSGSQRSTILVPMPRCVVKAATVRASNLMESNKMHTKRHLTLWLVTLVAVATLTTVLAFAANPHFVTGPTITTSANTATVCGKLAGLGNNQTIKVVFTAVAKTTCTNNGGNVPPGQTQTLTGTGRFTSDKNGAVSFCVTTNQASNPCPDGMKPTTSFSSFSVKVFDANGNQILP